MYFRDFQAALEQQGLTVEARNGFIRNAINSRLIGMVSAKDLIHTPIEVSRVTRVTIISTEITAVKAARAVCLLHGIEVANDY